ncbi:MAG: GNAT family N-acetyltransferase [Clostridia bacterium]|nr:GNAT family N-acetyltransferase [Clostridia bacterium]
MNHKGSKILKTERLVLRPFRVSDAEEMYANWASDPEVTKFLTWPPHNSAEDTRAILTLWEEESKQPNVYHWAITLEGELIGDIALHAVNESSERAVVGYCLSKKHWRKGIMPEALGCVLRYLFEEVGFHRIEAAHSVENPASGRVMEKCGLLYEGTARGEHRLLSTGEWTDIIHRAILREDYFARK